LDQPHASPDAIPPTPPTPPPTTGAPARPDFVCVGGMRCGSTTLWRMLRAHPGVFLPDRKELHHFDRDDAGGDAGYAAWFADAPAGAVRGEFTPSYMTREGVPERIAAALPGVKILIILRDPMERAWSHYWYRVRQGAERRAFLRAVRDESDDRRPDAWRWAYRGWSRYADPVGRCLDVFGEGRVRVVFSEELLADPAVVLDGIAGFLGLDAARFTVERAPESNAMVTPRLRTLYWMTKRADKAMRGRGGPARLAQRACFRASSLNLRRRRMPVPDGVRGRHAEWFGESDARLRELLGRALPWDR
jgi:hypothetical protein